MSAVGTVRLYGCGGTGINAVKPFIDFDSQGVAAQISTCFIDTSDSNIKDIADRKDDIFLMPDVDGSGKNRKKNLELVADRMPEVQGRWAPGDLNIVVTSMGGGSGSVIAPLLTKALLEEGQTVIVIAVAGFEDMRAAQNTVGSIQTFAQISSMVGKPIVMSLENNAKHGSYSKGRKASDEGIRATINSLAILAARNHAELDRADIHSWINYDEVTDVAGSFSLLDILVGEDQVADIQYPISIASLLVEDTDIDQAEAEYQCSGFPGEDTKVLLGGQNVHFVISTTEVDEMFEAFEKRKDEFEKRSKTRPTTKLSKPNDKANDLGIVL